MDLPGYSNEILAGLGGLILFFLLLPLYLNFFQRSKKTLWNYRIKARIDKRFRNQSNRPEKRGQTFVSDHLRRPLIWKPIRRAFGWWEDAGFGPHPLIFYFCCLGILLSGFLIGHFELLSSILSFFVSILFLFSFLAFIYFRAKIRNDRFYDQLPDLLDRLAGSLQAGFSLSQAIGFVAGNLPEPSASEMKHVFQRIQFGSTVEESLRELYDRRSDEAVRLLVEGLSLQCQVGGNIVELMFNLADLVRQKVELKNQIQTLTAQGRISALVLALLLPVSLGLLSLFPGYISVLFETRIGNLVLVSAGCLEVIGAAIIYELIRVDA